MSRPDNVVDLARYRLRRQARRQAEWLWLLYAAQAGQTAAMLVAQRNRTAQEA
ncbi:hypothetical protein OMP44_14190 [Pseudomonas sp. CBMAI 2609]|uniref:Uncharacterized protein n=1 Tax=Pseudomonas flavocrustae TaxID=2991719 RepID=A0ABT6IHT0_9PSED|nr:hypothetical protein [Pseudomonas sp. CBMAI 2609]MDH4764050.1 hypothetical protein [Pseudomonas sp. CBMAI 2609]